jgi:hypothetical protein
MFNCSKSQHGYGINLGDPFDEGEHTLIRTQSTNLVMSIELDVPHTRRLGLSNSCRILSCKSSMHFMQVGLVCRHVLSLHSLVACFGGLSLQLRCVRLCGGGVENF